jgi:NAD(P)-dependent dehydrogenase (short-subunit alcohol dehydrogenase family)
VPEPRADVSFDFTGRTVVVTGGTTGIGRAIAEGFRTAGADVVITGRRPQDAYDDEFTGLRHVQFDLVEPDGAATLAGHVGRCDVLVNNAGLMHRDPSELVPAGFEATVEANLNGTFRVCHALRPLIPAGGSIINIASLTAVFGSPRVVAYSATKGAIVQLTRSLALAWAADGIRVNALAPGWIETDLTAGHVADPERSGQILDRTPLGRWGEPDDLAGPALFLASDAARFITGATLMVDGGYSVA